MTRRWQQTGLFKWYAIIFFLTIMLVAMGITLLLLDFSSDKFVAYELDNVKASMTAAVNDLEKQYKTMRDVAYQIRSTYDYRPGVVQEDVSRELAVLEDFSRYTNYSPLIGKYFLMYHNSEKIYTSEGKTSYFSYYLANQLGLSEYETDTLFLQLNALEEETVLSIGKKLLFLFPIRFTNVNQELGNAVLCFLLSPEEAQNRMQTIASILPDHSVLKLQDSTLWEEDLPGGENIYQLDAVSDEGMVHLSGTVEIDRWPLLLSSVPQWLYVGIVLAFVAVSALAVLLAQAAVRPLKHLLRKYAPPTDQLQNEFVQLDRLVARIEEENQHSARVLRDRTLMMILQGYYSERVIGRWGLTPLHFDKAQYCAAVMRVGSSSPDEIEALVSQIESLSNEKVRVFAVQLPMEAMIAIIIGFSVSAEKEKLVSQFTGLLPEHASLFVGEVCTTPQRLSASYVDALSAYQHGAHQEIMDARSYVLRMVAACESGQTELQAQLQQQMSAQYEHATLVLTKKLATELVREISSLAVQKHVALDNERLSGLTILSNMELLLADAQGIICQAFHREAAPQPDRTNQTAMAIVEYIQVNSGNPDLNLSDISLHFGLSNDYISAMVKNITGLAFKEYLTDLRMRHACAMLIDRRDMTVTEISEAVGYRKPSNFIKKFKEVYGVTPSQYR